MPLNLSFIVSIKTQGGCEKKHGKLGCLVMLTLSTLPGARFLGFRRSVGLVFVLQLARSGPLFGWPPSKEGGPNRTHKKRVLFGILFVPER
jgi:hypothetical protein